MIATPLLDFISHSPEQTLLVGEHLGGVCEGGEMIWLEGGLGAGKTVLTQGIARGLGIDTQVTSPTFTVLKEYRGTLALHHFDFYRLEGTDREPELEFEEYLRPDAVCVVEWAENAPSFLPEQYLRVSLRFVSETKRSVRVAPRGPDYGALIRRFQAIAFRP